MLRQWFHAHPQAMRLAVRMFDADTLEEQEKWYSQLEPRFLNEFICWAVRRHFVQSLLGVPVAQQQLAALQYKDGMSGYVRHCLRKVFVQQSLQDNYFWRLYFFGKYAPACCPNYLRPEYHGVLKQRVGRLHTYNTSINDFLKTMAQPITHFVLLDHQDWLATHQYALLQEEWQLIFEKAAPGARILFRSASPVPDFLPPVAQKKVCWDLRAARLQQMRDRVSTYASTWIGTIEK
jgi:S-adenosylmethionine-diacylglycerol 3-amino-3-carboxypropyl transferase